MRGLREVSEAGAEYDRQAGVACHTCGPPSFFFPCCQSSGDGHYISDMMCSRFMMAIHYFSDW